MCRCTRTVVVCRCVSLYSYVVVCRCVSLCVVVQLISLYIVRQCRQTFSVGSQLVRKRMEIRCRCLWESSWFWILISDGKESTTTERCWAAEFSWGKKIRNPSVMVLVEICRTRVPCRISLKATHKLRSSLYKAILIPHSGVSLCVCDTSVQM